MKKISVITEILEELENVELTLFLRMNKDDYRGEITITHRGEKFLFEIKIPQTYPLSSGPLSIRFYPKEEYLKDCNHINLDGSICLHPQKSHVLKEKLISEIELLKEWIELYYFRRIEEDKKEYLLYSTIFPFSRLLFTDVNFSFKKFDFGEFEFSSFGKGSVGIVSSFFKMENKKGIYERVKSVPCQWSEYYTNPPHQLIGLWIYIEDEPLRKGFLSRKIVLNWDELGVYLDEPTLAFLLTQIQKYDSFVSVNSYYDLLIGYKIGEEVHWQLIKILASKIPIKKITNTNTTTCSIDKISILWGNTENASYHRFFGRGKLADKITEKKILIIGVGALGSSLAVYLTRGGAKNLDIIDFDFVGVGNICRSHFRLEDVGDIKVDTLGLQLIHISPHINVHLNRASFFKDYENKQFIDYLSSFDFIFDCSADMEVLYVLNQIKSKLYNALIYSLALSNEAKELVCVTGNKMAKLTNIIFDKLPKPKELFYEGIGCQYPTYNARNNEINMLLSTALSYIDNKIRSSEGCYSFIVKNELNQNPARINIHEY